MNGVDDVRRPNPLLWLRYTFTGSLPPSYAGWVLHDASTGTWWLRHVVRFLVQVLPVAVLAVLLVPASWPIKIGVALMGVVGTALFALGYVVEGAERRIEKAGYRYGLATEIRQQRALDNQRATAERNRARREARLAKRSGR